MKPPSIRFHIGFVLFMAGLIIPCTSRPGLSLGTDPSSSDKVVGSEAGQTRVQGIYNGLPLFFIENKGQVSRQVEFYEQGRGHATYFTKDGVYLDLSGVQGTEVRTLKPGTSVPASRHVRIRLSPLGANKETKVTAEGVLEGRMNYFIGRDPKKWRTDIPLYRATVYHEIYPGIDMKFYGNDRQLEYDIVIKPGADPSRVRLAYEGITDLRLVGQGDLEIVLKDGKIVQKKPTLYQVIDGKRWDVTGTFRLFKAEKSDRSRFAYGFEVASYDRRHPLYIDPTLVYSTYLGGSGNDAGRAIAVDASGYVYVTGSTDSVDFPVTSGVYDSSFNGGTRDVVIAKLNPAASGTASLVYATYLGGSDDEVGRGVALDASGNAYVTGYTYSSDFPATAGSFDQTFNGNFEAFVFKLNPAGSGLVYSTYLGGNDGDFGYGIGVDNSGNAVVTGQTASSDFPVTASAFQPTFAGATGNSDAFVSKLNASGSNLLYSTYLGGAGWDTGFGIAMDDSGRIYIAGHTDSVDFPTTPAAYNVSSNGDFDAFVAKLDPTASGPASLAYATYLGGSGSDAFFGGVVAVDGAGNAYVAGNTSSSDFPVTPGAYDPSYNGNGDLFIAKLEPTGSSLLFATYLGGSQLDQEPHIAVDSSGNVYVAGNTTSVDFPTTGNAYSTTYSGGMGSDVFVAKLDTNGGSLLFGTYLGGTNTDIFDGLAVDDLENAYVTGFTSSIDFPTTSGAFDSSFNGSTYDFFIAKLQTSLPDLIMTDVSTTASTVAPGESLPLYNSVMNQGGAAAGSFAIAFHLSTDATYGGPDDIAFSYSRSVSSLGIGATSATTSTLTLPAGTPLGNYYLCAVADSNGSVDEGANEANNALCTAGTVEVVQLTAPDLVMTQVTPGASSVNAGDVLSVTDTVLNQGSVASGTFRVGYALSPTMDFDDPNAVGISTIRLVQLDPGENSTATTNLAIPTSTPPNNYYLCAKADTTDSVTETNEDNNVLCSGVVTVPPPDLVIPSITTTYSAIAPGNYITVPTTVLNQGGVRAYSFTIAFHLSADPTYGGADDVPFTETWSISSLGSGDSYSSTRTMTVPAGTPLGTYYVCAMADSSNTVDEWDNEDNNAGCTATTIEVTLPDLVMTATSTNASSPLHPGSRFYVANTVENQGLVNSSAFRIGFSLSPSNPPSYDDPNGVAIPNVRTRSSLAAGATSSANTRVTVPSGTPSGVYYVCTKADSISQVVETDEDNNTLCSVETVTVQ